MFAVGLVSGVVVWAVKDVVAPDFLDLRKQRRAAELQRAAEQRMYEREDEPTRRRIAAAVSRQVTAMRRVFIHGEFSLEEWQHWHDELKGLVEDTGGARAVGDDYPRFVEALDHDQLCMNIQRGHESQWREPGNPESGSARYAVRQHDAHTAENVASSILQFVPLMEALGIAEARNFERSAQQQIELSRAIYNEMPPFG